MLRCRIADAAYIVFVAVVVLLAFLPTGISATRQTISAYALSPDGDLLVLGFGCLALGSALAAYEFWRSVSGIWGVGLATLTAVWVCGAVIDTVVDVNPVGIRTLHGAVHAVVAVVAFSAVAVTVLVFLAWLRLGRGVGRLQAPAVVVSVLALVSVAFELTVTVLSLVPVAGTAERLYFGCALAWMTVARYAVSGAPAPDLASAPALPSTPVEPLAR